MRLRWVLLPLLPQFYWVLWAAPAQAEIEFETTIISDVVPAGLVDIAAADLSGDGLADFVAVSGADEETTTISWYENNIGSNVFTRHVVTTSNPMQKYSLGVADLNNDDIPDIIVSATTGGLGSFQGFTSTAGGTDPDHEERKFRFVSISSLNGFRAVDVADMDQDGDIDVVVANANDNSVYVFINDGTGSGWERIVATSVARDASTVAVGDMDGDGWLDIVYCFLDDGNTVVSWVRSLGGAVDGGDDLGFGFDPPSAVDIHAGIGPTAIAVEDLNNDGSLDVVVAGSGSLTWHLSNGDGSNWTTGEIDTSTDGGGDVTIVDMNGDGYRDIVVAALYAGVGEDTVVLYLNDGDLIFSRHVLGSSGKGTGVAAADMNNDGTIDIVSSSTADNSVSIFWQQASLTELTEPPTMIPVTPPTTVPTASPTAAPGGGTVSPSMRPETPPTTVPTAAPTAAPRGGTVSPSMRPETPPTTVPTAAPTAAPRGGTVSPSMRPETPPTTVPTAAPTAAPGGGTVSPSMRPEAPPTIAPTAETLNPLVIRGEDPAPPTIIIEPGGGLSPVEERLVTIGIPIFGLLAPLLGAGFYKVFKVWHQGGNNNNDNNNNNNNDDDDNNNNNNDNDDNNNNNNNNNSNNNNSNHLTINIQR